MEGGGVKLKLQLIVKLLDEPEAELKKNLNRVAEPPKTGSN